MEQEECKLRLSSPPTLNTPKQKQKEEHDAPVTIARQTILPNNYTPPPCSSTNPFKIKYKRQRRLGLGNAKGYRNGYVIRESVQLPAGEDLNDWIALNTMELSKTMNMCYGILTEFCTENSCPQMTAGAKVTYYWASSIKEKPVSLPAPHYIEHLILWIAEQFDNPEIFPVSSDFGRQFIPTVKKILSRMFRVYAHIYHSHWEKVKSLRAEAHINTCFKYFYFFVSEFELVEEKDLQPLQPLIDKLK